MITEDDFEAAVRLHDLTYTFADDPAVWRKGRASLNTLHAMAAEIGQQRAKEIWDKVVDEKLLDGERKNFYWTEV